MIPDNSFGDFELREEDIFKGTTDEELEAEIAAGEYSGQMLDDGGYAKYTEAEWDWILSVYRTQDHSHKDWERVQLMIMDAMYPFCKYVARRYYSTYTSKHGDDLVNVGYIGMLNALESYNPRKGSPTTWCIREIIHADRDYIDQMEHHTSKHFSSNLQKIQKIIARKEREGISWEPDDLSIELGLSPTTVENCLQIYQRNRDQVSMDAPVGDSDVKIGDRLVSDFPDPLQSVMEGEGSEALRRAMREYLDDKEYLAVCYAYGFEDDDPKRAPEIVKATAKLAPEFRIRQQEVRRLLNSARFKLKRGLVIDRSMDDDIYERSLCHSYKRSDNTTEWIPWASRVSIVNEAQQHLEDATNENNQTKDTVSGISPEQRLAEIQEYDLSALGTEGTFLKETINEESQCVIGEDFETASKEIRRLEGKIDILSEKIDEIEKVLMTATPDTEKPHEAMQDIKADTLAEAVDMMSILRRRKYFNKYKWKTYRRAKRLKINHSRSRQGPNIFRKRPPPC